MPALPTITIADVMTATKPLIDRIVERQWNDLWLAAGQNPPPPWNDLTREQKDGVAVAFLRAARDYD